MVNLDKFTTVLAQEMDVAQGELLSTKDVALSVESEPVELRKAWEEAGRMLADAIDAVGRA